MSKFSGKFDFCDEISILGLDAVLRSEVYVGESPEPLRLTCLADCVPYYPYVPSVVAYNSVTGRGFIRLTEKSWVDIEEERYGHSSWHDYCREELKKAIKEAGIHEEPADRPAEQ